MWGEAGELNPFCAANSSPSIGYWGEVREQGKIEERFICAQFGTLLDFYYD